MVSRNLTQPSPHPSPEGRGGVGSLMRLFLTVQKETRTPGAPRAPSIVRWARAALAGSGRGSAVITVRLVDAAESAALNKRYRGKFRFAKHFYPVLSDLEDGSEEWRCAVALDEHPMVKRWVRNLDSDPVAGFWLPTSTGRFYPHFVCELADRRVLVAEYKSDHLRNIPKEIEKGQVGRVWSESSGGRAVFAMLFKLENGMAIAQQIDAALGGHV